MTRTQGARCSLILLWIVLAWALAATACAPYSASARPRDVSAQLGACSNHVRALFFPAQWRAPGERPLLVLVGPEVLDAKVLYGYPSTLVPYLTYQGYPVLVVDAVDGPLPESFGSQDLPRLLGAIGKHMGAKSIVVGGVSLGGRHVLSLLSTLETSPSVFVGLPRVSKVFFLAVGFDYAYPRALPERLTQAGLGKQDLGEQCRLKSNARACETLFRSSVRPQGYSDLLRFLSASLRSTQAPWQNVERLSTSALFLVGKTDNVSPSESVWPIYNRYGTSRQAVDKRYFVVGRENQLGRDYDELSIFLDDHAAKEVYPILSRWIEE